MDKSIGFGQLAMEVCAKYWQLHGVSMDWWPDAGETSKVESDEQQSFTDLRKVLSELSNGEIQLQG